MRREQKNNTLTFKVKEETELLPFLMKAMNGISRNRAKALLVNRLVLVDNIITTHALARLVPGQTVILDRSKQKMAFRSNDLGVVYEATGHSFAHKPQPVQFSFAIGLNGVPLKTLYVP